MKPEHLCINTSVVTIHIFREALVFLNGITDVLNILIMSFTSDAHTDTNGKIIEGLFLRILMGF